MTLALNDAAPRKNLSAQLDRLDRILDGMVDGLHGAVADSVKDAVAVAVKEAITQVLTDPALLKRLHEVQRAAAPAQPNQRQMHRIGKVIAGFWNRVKSLAKAGCIKAKAAAKVSRSRAKVAIASNWLFAQAKVRIAVKRFRLVVRVLTLLARKAKRLLWQFRKPVLLAAGVGAVVGLGCYFAGPYMVALVAGASCGGVAGAVAEWLPRIDRIIARRRMMAEAVAA